MYFPTAKKWTRRPEPLTLMFSTEFSNFPQSTVEQLSPQIITFCLSPWTELSKKLNNSNPKNKQNPTPNHWKRETVQHASQNNSSSSKSYTCSTVSGRIGRFGPYQTTCLTSHQSRKQLLRRICCTKAGCSQLWQKIQRFQHLPFPFFLLFHSSTI